MFFGTGKAEVAASGHGFAANTIAKTGGTIRSARHNTTSNVIPTVLCRTMKQYVCLIKIACVFSHSFGKEHSRSLVVIQSRSSSFTRIAQEKHIRVETKTNDE